MPGHGFKTAVLSLALLIGATGASSLAVPFAPGRGHADAIITVPDAATGDGMHLSPGDATPPTVLTHEVVEQGGIRDEASRESAGLAQPRGAGFKRPPGTPVLPDGGRLLGLLARPANAPPRS